MHHLNESIKNVGEALLVLAKIKKKFEKVRNKKRNIYYFISIIIFFKGLYRYVKTNNCIKTSCNNMYYL